jgi:hypothetical protein
LETKCTAVRKGDLQLLTRVARARQEEFLFYHCGLKPFLRGGLRLSAHGAHQTSLTHAAAAGVRHIYTMPQQAIKYGLTGIALIFFAV